MNVDEMCLGLGGSIRQWVAGQRPDLMGPPASVPEEAPWPWR